MRTASFSLPAGRAFVSAVVSVAALVASVGHAQTVRNAAVVLKEGDAILGSTVSSLGEPFTNSLGNVGFVYSTAAADRGIFIGNSSIFDDTVQITYSGGEATMGISDAGGFAYSPSVGGNDSVVTHLGVLVSEGNPAPVTPAQFTSFASRPRMVANGSVAWIGGVANTAGGATAARVMYLNRLPGDPANTSELLRGGQTISGATIAASGVTFTYDISDNASQYVNVVTFTGSTATDAGVIRNAGTIVMREGSPTGDGDNWQGFGAVGVNDVGVWLVTGDTDGPTSSDTFVAIDGEIVLREGEFIDSGPVGSTISAASISQQGKVAFIAVVGGVETLVTGKADTLNAITAETLAQVGDLLDFNADGVGDATLDNFLASNTVAPGLDLADDGRVFARCTITPTNGTPVDAIVRFSLPSACDSIDFNGDGLFPDDTDLIDFLSVLAGGPCSTNLCNDIDFNNDGLFPDDLDLLTFLLVLAGGRCE